MTFDLISGLHMQIQTWYPPLIRCIHAEYYIKSVLTNVLKNANRTQNMHLFRFGFQTINNLTVKNKFLLLKSSALKHTLAERIS